MEDQDYLQKAFTDGHVQLFTSGRTEKIRYVAVNHIVHINGYAFGLNGAVRSHLKIPCPHAAGLAVLGKSVGPFIDLAFEL